MDGNTIFQNPVQLGQNPNAEAQQNPVEQDQSQPPYVFHPSSSPISPKKLIKILLGVIAIVAIGFFIFKIVIPRFQKIGVSKATLTYWGLWEDASVMQSTISDFNRQYPNITINYSKQDIKQYRERLLARIPSGIGPDIFRFHNTWVQMLSAVLLPLSSETITKADFIKWFYPVAQRDLIKNGAIYGIPLEIDTLSLYINKNIFESAGLSPPNNWVDFINDARQLTVKDGSGKIKTAGAALGIFSNVTHAPDIISLLFVQNGVYLNNIFPNDQAAAEALVFYTSFATGSSSTWDSSFDPSILAFAKENLAMYFGYSWDFFTIKALNPKLTFETHPVPHLPNQNMTIASYWAEGVSVKSKYQKEAMLFMKYLAQKESEQKLFAEQSKTRAFGEPYARVDLANLLKDNAVVYPFVSQGNEAVSSFFASDTSDNGLNSKSNTYLGDAVNSMLNGASPQSAVDTLSKGVNQVLQQYGSK